jgi:hypothetical protein
MPSVIFNHTILKGYLNKQDINKSQPLAQDDEVKKS